MWFLTVRQPWAHGLVEGFSRNTMMLSGREVKPGENRGWRPVRVQTPFVMGIHAGATYDTEGAQWIREQFSDRKVVVPTEDELARAGKMRAVVGAVLVRECLRDLSTLTRRAREWAFGPVWWRTQYPRYLRQPYPWEKGHRGLWSIEEGLPEELLELACTVLDHWREGALWPETPKPVPMQEGTE